MESEHPHSLPHPLPEGVESRPSLLRALGMWMAIAIVVGNVIGSGIFAKPGEIATNAGCFWLIISGWIFGGGLCILGALCFAELAAMLPRAGGLYVYLKEAYGRPVAFLFGFNEFVFGRPASIGALAVYFVSLLAGVGQWGTITTFTSVTTALVIIAGVAWVNVLGVIWGGRLQGLTTLIKAGFLAFLAILPFVLWGGGAEESITLANYSSKIVPAQPTLSTQFAAVLLAVMWAYNGWHDVAPVAEEIRDPQRNIPRSLMGGVAILIVLYVGVNFAYHGVLSMQEISMTSEDALRNAPEGSLKDGTAQAMIRRLFSPFGSTTANNAVGLMSAVIMCSVFGAINSNLLLGPRVSFAMGRDDVFVRQLGDVHVNYRTPAVSIVVQAMMSGALVIASGVLVELVESFREKSIFQMMTDYVTFSASIFYMLCVLGVLVLRWKHPEWERPYRTWGYPFVPIAFLAAYTWFLIQVYQAKPFESRMGLLIIAGGLPIYYGWKAWASRHPQQAS